MVGLGPEMGAAVGVFGLKSRQSFMETTVFISILLVMVKHKPENVESTSRLCGGFRNPASFDISKVHTSQELLNSQQDTRRSNLVMCYVNSNLKEEGLVALRLAKEVIWVQQGVRTNSIKNLNETDGFSRSLANSTTDSPYLLLELLSGTAQADYFQFVEQPKLIINNIEVDS
ncbi:hypothetical protein CTI12_AA550190 [Artemisia annua]|uniref:Uncharacterized protein n=1 Tax=Artemisia annua TaxID=35608 RepID=A0A2U1KYN3_ARTAN|nr:hypothetical protein CTI12_AA550190 [Artemisia annua]